MQLFGLIGEIIVVSDVVLHEVYKNRLLALFERLWSWIGDNIANTAHHY